MKKLVLTGGGTAGHVTPNLALLPMLQKRGYEVVYIGSEHGIEEDLISCTGIPYYSIPTGKLRRYFSWENFTDALRVLSGIKESMAVLKKISPSAVFSKGGFVAVPVVLAARILGIPVILHESDMTPGLANRLAIPFAKRICTTFSETIDTLPSGKGVHTGSPIRRELLLGDSDKGLHYCGFSQQKPVLLMIGGSLGSVAINQCLRDALPELLKTFQVAHICGKGNIEPSLEALQGYRQFTYIKEELADIFAAADVIVSRAGSNSICEFLALQKPNLLIPLSLQASRGDQIQNAASFERKGFSIVLQEEELTPEALNRCVAELYQNRKRFQEAMQKYPLSDGVEEILHQIDEIVGE